MKTQHFPGAPHGTHASRARAFAEVPEREEGAAPRNPKSLPTEKSDGPDPGRLGDRDL